MRDDELLKELRDQVADCHLCTLHESRNNVVFGAGVTEPIILFVGEAPGRTEDEKGIPFVDDAGDLFAKILRAAEISREHIFVTNILKCKPPGNRMPSSEQVATCLPYLMGQIALLKPSFLVTLGRASSSALLGTNQPMERLRGKWHKRRGLLILPTYHPAELLKNEGLKSPTWDDFQMIRDTYRDCLENSSAKGD